ncbi:CHY zinc finger protein [Salirhabdus euzebyi]
MDPQTRCKHYHSNQDIIAIRLGCCNVYYSCYECHEELADHPASPVPKEHFHQQHIFCGLCHSILTVHEYLNSNNNCPNCNALFNPNCKLHYHLYFE